MNDPVRSENSTSNPHLPVEEQASDAALGASKLAASVAHELNNPLDAVLRFVSLAQRKARAGEFTDVERYLTDAQFGLQRMAEILRELMDIGREANELLDRGAIQSHVCLADLIGGAMRTASAQAEQKNVTLVVKNLLPEECRPAYDLRLSQVLSNLLKNAVEATPEDTYVRIGVELGGPQGSPTVLISVQDSGPGLPEDLLLFKPFVTTKPRGAGHGLGLAISRELVISLGGTLTLANRGSSESAHHGCVATIRLPLNELSSRK